MLHVDPRSPEYVGTARALDTCARRRRRGPLLSRRFTRRRPRTVTSIVEARSSTNYAVDGVHLDYVRYPDEEFDYSRPALEQFKAAVRPELSRRGAPARRCAERIDPLAYPNLFPERWNAFRRSRLTTLVMRVRTAVKAARPNAMLSAARGAGRGAGLELAPAGLAARGSISRCSTCCARWPTRQDVDAFAQQIRRGAGLRRRRARCGPASAPIASRAGRDARNTSPPRGDWAGGDHPLLLRRAHRPAQQRGTLAETRPRRVRGRLAVTSAGHSGLHSADGSRPPQPSLKSTAADLG